MKGLYFRGTSSSSEPVEPYLSGPDLVIPSGAGEVRLRFSDLALSIGGDQGRYLVAKAQMGGGDHEIYLEREGLLRELEDDGVPAYTLDRIRALDGAARATAWKLRGALVLTLALMLAGFVLTVLFAEDLAVRAVSMKWERKLGEASLDSQNALLWDEGELHAFVREVTDRIVAANREAIGAYRFDVHIAVDDTPNAYAAPGGIVVVHTGLFTAAVGPEEIAGVLGHEIAHVIRRHGLRGAVRKLGITAAVGVILDGGASLAIAAGQLGSLSHSRGMESEADRIGVELLHNAGLDPTAVGRFVARLSAERTVNPPTFLSTHPGGMERLKQVSEWVKVPTVTSVEPRCDTASRKGFSHADHRRVLRARRLAAALHTVASAAPENLRAASVSLYCGYGIASDTRVCRVTAALARRPICQRLA